MRAFEFAARHIRAADELWLTQTRASEPQRPLWVDCGFDPTWTLGSFAHLRRLAPGEQTFTAAPSRTPALGRV
jgi:hypothetical protein